MYYVRNKDYDYNYLTQPDAVQLPALLQSPCLRPFQMASSSNIASSMIQTPVTPVAPTLGESTTFRPTEVTPPMLPMVPQLAVPQRVDSLLPLALPSPLTLPPLQSPRSSEPALPRSPEPAPEPAPAPAPILPLGWSLEQQYIFEMLCKRNLAAIEHYRLAHLYHHMQQATMNQRPGMLGELSPTLQDAPLDLSVHRSAMQHRQMALQMYPTAQQAYGQEINGQEIGPLTLRNESEPQPSTSQATEQGKHKV